MPRAVIDGESVPKGRRWSICTSLKLITIDYLLPYILKIACILFPPTSIAVCDNKLFQTALALLHQVTSSTSNCTKMQSALAGYYPLNDPCTVHTHASFTEQPVSKASTNTINGWALMLPVPLPSTITNLVLQSVLYTIKYATAHSVADSTVQADVVLTSTSCPTGIVVDGTDLLVYHPKSGYAPPLVNEDKAMLLSSNPGIKQNKGSGSWEHYVDHQRINPNIAFRVREPVNLYLAFHVFEYPLAAMNRALCVEVSARWWGNLKG